jgi:cob(I)alamin adenosyltransferase
VIINTGKGKGKSTAGFGMVFRALGHGMKIGIVQFVKGSWDTGERWVLEKFPEQVTISALGEGFTWKHRTVSATLKWRAVHGSRPRR